MRAARAHISGSEGVAVRRLEARRSPEPCFRRPTLVTSLPTTVRVVATNEVDYGACAHTLRLVLVHKVTQLATSVLCERDDEAGEVRACARPGRAEVLEA